jgi:hypothetical protein
VEVLGVLANMQASEKFNQLYLGVLPIIHVSNNPILGYGMTEQTITLYPDKNFATEFFQDEVDSYIDAFFWRANKYLVGGHVLRYECEKEVTDDERVIVQVKQYVR